MSTDIETRAAEIARISEIEEARIELMVQYLRMNDSLRTAFRYAISSSDAEMEDEIRQYAKVQGLKSKDINKLYGRSYFIERGRE